MTGAHPGRTQVVDLRSDTVTRPSPGMREAMAHAEVGDDVYAEDPTVAALEAEVAQLLGHEAGLFFPTGSLANQVGVALLVPPGAELLCDVTAHVVRAEMGAHGALGGVTTRTWPSPDGVLDAEVPLAMAAPDAGPYLVSTAAIAVENTHNFGGGRIQPIAQLRALRQGAQGMGVATHLDGARLWNAHVATGVPLGDYGACFDTVSVCLSKGLGAPVGSVLVASAALIARARVLRKRYGAGMRQVGVLAAAGSYALQHNLSRLSDDHARAARLARACAKSAPGVCDPDTFPTNIVVLDLAAAPAWRSAAEFAAAAAEQSVRVSVLGRDVARLVTHLDVDDDACDTAADVLGALLAR